ncbi:MAG: RusA family crossover junction endodeoxyribonuclease [Candidatus Binatia bacterium]
MNGWHKVAEFFIYGNPRPWKAAFTSAKRGSFTVLTEADVAWRQAVRDASTPHLPRTPIVGPVRVDSLFYMKRPKRLNRKNDPVDPIFCDDNTTDRINLAKLLEDLLEPDPNVGYSGFYLNDRQVCDGAPKNITRPRAETRGRL